MLYFSKPKIFTILAILLIGLMFALPNFLSEDRRNSLPGIMPSETINLGLDLQGGAHMLLEVDVPDVINNLLKSELDDARVKLREERIRISNITQKEDEITGRFANAEDVDRGMEVLESLSQQVEQGSLAKTLNVEKVGDTGFRITPTDAYIESVKKRTIDQSMDVLRRRIDPTGTTEMTIAPEGDDRIVLQVPGAKDISDIKEKISETANMTFHLVREADSAEIQRAMSGSIRPGYEIYPDRFGGMTMVRARPIVTGDDLKSTAPTFDQDGNIVVAFNFNNKGARAFGRVTTENTGERFAVVLDGEIITAPVMRVPILDGRGVIEGGFTQESAKDLSDLLNAGALPAKLIITEERTVGADLGEDSIRAGRIAAMIGLGGVIAFMFIMYGLRFGTFANLALMFNIALILGALSMLGATLTLPGIAGIILTIGMAVDANVIIFERIREEFANGRPPLNAIDTGYRASLSAVYDANITTFIAAGMLYLLGSGPIRGFAVTLVIGIITSVFTAIFVARLMTSLWHKRARPKTMPI